MNFDERKRDETVFFKAFSNIRAIVEDQIAEGDKVANRITMHCTQTGEYQGIPAT
jgi:predicted ester cyclase